MYQCVKTSFICRAHHTRHRVAGINIEWNLYCQFSLVTFQGKCRYSCFVNERLQKEARKGLSSSGERRFHTERENQSQDSSHDAFESSTCLQSQKNMTCPANLLNFNYLQKHWHWTKAASALPCSWQIITDVSRYVYAHKGCGRIVLFLLRRVPNWVKVLWSKLQPWWELFEFSKC